MQQPPPPSPHRSPPRSRDAVAPGSAAERAPPRHRRTPGECRVRPESATILLAALLLALATAACGEEAGAVQDAVVPSDPQVVQRRADRARLKGDTTAPVQLVEISDFQCPYCARFYRETYPVIDSLYVRTGKVEYVWISMASPGHPYAWPAVEAAFCAGAVGRFWPMHDLLFERQDEWSQADAPVDRFVEYAREVGVDPASFEACVRQDRPAPLQVSDLQQVVRAGIGGTPFFIIDGSTTIQGAAGTDRFRTVLDSALRAASAQQEGG